MVSELEIISMIAGSVSLTLLFFAGGRIRSMVGDHMFNLVVTLFVLTGLYGTSVIWRVLWTIFPTFWLFGYFEYGSYAFMAIFLIAKLKGWV